ncbi:MAG: cupin domain-containing protein [Candidatus Eremiobacteraeota bacterium]|nr:cupin domain-containing protein [Candidatus Eremiobacteraeota bacterium]
MKSRLVLALILGLAMMSAGAGSSAPTIVSPAQVHWMPGTGTLAGMQMAVLFGSPAKSGPFTIRIKVPDGLKMASHFHAGTERVTVISGTFLAGVGDTMDATKMMTFGPGTFIVMPANVHHYASVKGETVVQVEGMGPMSMVMVKAKK